MPRQAREVFRGLYLKDQIVPVLASWGVPTDLPKRDREILLSFPAAESVTAPWTATITRYKRKSTYGKPLYEVVIHNYEEQPT